MINNIHYEEALNNILIVVIAAAVVLVLVMLLGSKKSRFRKKLSAFFADDTVGTCSNEPCTASYKNFTHFPVSSFLSRCVTQGILCQQFTIIV